MMIEMKSLRVKPSFQLHSVVNNFQTERNVKETGKEGLLFKLEPSYMYVLNGGNEANEGNIRSSSSLKMFVTLVFDFGFSVQKYCFTCIFMCKGICKCFLEVCKNRNKK